MISTLLPRRLRDAVPTEMLKHGSLFTLLNLLRLVAGMGAGLLCARALAPDKLGLWNTIGLVGTYAPLLTLGVFSGLGRNLPYALGADDRDKARSLAAASLGVAWALAALSAILLAIPTCYFAARGHIQDSFVVASYVVSISLGYPTSHLRVLYRTTSDFNKMAAADLAMAVVGLLTVLLVQRLGLTGMALRGALLAAGTLVLLDLGAPMREKGRWLRKETRSLIATGAPIMGSDFVYRFVDSLDTTALAVFGGPRAVGLYAVAKLVQSTVNTLTSSVGTMLYPRMCHRLGESRSPARLARMTFGSVAGLFAALTATAAAGHIVLKLALPIVLPKYIEGLQAALVMNWAMTFRAADVFNDVFAALRRMDLFIAAVLSGALAMVAAWVPASRFYVSVTAAAICVFVRYAVTAVVLSVAGARLIRQDEAVHS